MWPLSFRPSLSWSIDNEEKIWRVTSEELGFLIIIFLNSHRSKHQLLGYSSFGWLPNPDIHHGSHVFLQSHVLHERRFCTEWRSLILLGWFVSASLSWTERGQINSRICVGTNQNKLEVSSALNFDDPQWSSHEVSLALPAEVTMWLWMN